MHEVHKPTLEFKAAEAILSLRTAHRLIKVVHDWLADNPGYDQDSHLVKTLGFTEDEAYRLCSVFDELDSAREALVPTMALARTFTGLE